MSEEKPLETIGTVVEARSAPLYIAWPNGVCQVVAIRHDTNMEELGNAESIMSLTDVGGREHVINGLSRKNASRLVERLRELMRVEANGDGAAHDGCIPQMLVLTKEDLNPKA